MYPWGDTFHAMCGNFSRTGIGQLSAVGTFPEGAGAYGVQDMVGNVWEWTPSLWGPERKMLSFPYPYQLISRDREDLGAPDTVMRVLRGPSFDYDEGARIATRGRAWPNTTGTRLGFRLAVSRLTTTLSNDRRLSHSTMPDRAL